MAFVISYAINARVYNNGPVKQGLSVIKVQACAGLCNSKALHHRATRPMKFKGIFSILQGKMS